MRRHLLTAGEMQAHIAGLELVEVDRRDADRAQQLHLVATRLRDEALGQIAAADALWKSRVVVDPLGDAGLAAEPAALDDDGLDAFARGIDGGRQPGRAPAHDGEVVRAPLGFEVKPELARQILVGGFEQVTPVAEDDGRDDAAAALQLVDDPHAGGALIDVDPVVRHALLGEESLGALAVRAPGRAVDGDVSHAVSSRFSAACRGCLSRPRPCPESA